MYKRQILARSLVKGLYLYEPKAFMGKMPVPIYQMPRITADNPICYQCLKSLAENVDITPYQNRRIYFFPVPELPQYKKDLPVSEQVLQIILDTAGGDSLLVKLHANDLKCETDISRLYPLPVYVDVQKRPFEAIAIQMDLSLIHI